LIKAIGIDLGGTNIHGGIISVQGIVTKSIVRETGRGVGAAEVIRRIALVINELLGYEDDVVGIGIGSPGFIDIDKGKVLSVGGNIEGWAGTNIRDELLNYFPNYKIVVGNDANIAAICEGWLGAGKDLNSFIMLTIGTGLGGAIYTKNHGIWKGHNFQGGELGHAILYPNGRKCSCGQYGCAEQYVSGPAIEKLYYEQTGAKKSGKEIFRLCNIDDNAQLIVNNFAENLAIYISSLKNIFDPEGIIIGGGVIDSREYWWDKMINNYLKYVNDSQGMKIVSALYLNDAGMIGAGKLVFDFH
jgi:glucokinase